MALSNVFLHEIRIVPTVSGGNERLWTASVSEEHDDEAVMYDGQGTTIEMALCDLIDSLAGAVEERRDH